MQGLFKLLIEYTTGYQYFNDYQNETFVPIDVRLSTTIEKFTVALASRPAMRFSYITLYEMSGILIYNDLHHCTPVLAESLLKLFALCLWYIKACFGVWRKGLRVAIGWWQPEPHYWYCPPSQLSFGLHREKYRNRRSGGMIGFL
jgi:hypothetical protein